VQVLLQPLHADHWHATARRGDDARPQARSELALAMMRITSSRSSSKLGDPTGAAEKHEGTITHSTRDYDSCKQGNDTHTYTQPTDDDAAAANASPCVGGCWCCCCCCADEASVWTGPKRRVPAALRGVTSPSYSLMGSAATRGLRAGRVARSWSLLGSLRRVCLEVVYVVARGEVGKVAGEVVVVEVLVAAAVAAEIAIVRDVRMQEEECTANVCPPVAMVVHTCTGGGGGGGWGGGGACRQ
jgi:hypothetical protein